ncbi:MAG TPA: HAD family hydrolase [Herpetosiphonaceae bacterium]
MRTLLLWDIDGTLMRGDTAVLQRFIQALREVYALPAVVRRIDYGGKTDGQIVLETLALHDIDETIAFEHLPRFRDRYYQLMDEIAHELHRSLRLLPGVVPVLEQLRERGAIQTLLTGNMEPVAAMKLRALGLEQYFDLAIGAYGSDHHDRNKLVPIARRKAAERHADRIGATVVIGDTPRDIACGRAGDARVVAVATGRFSGAQLEAHAPDALLTDLSDTDAAVEAILGKQENKRTRDHRDSSTS